MSTIPLPELISSYSGTAQGFLVCRKNNEKYVDSLNVLYTSGNALAKALSDANYGGSAEHVNVRLFAEPLILEWAKKVEKKADESTKLAVDAVEKKYKDDVDNFKKSGEVFALSLAKKAEENASLAKEKSELEEKLFQKEKQIALLEQQMKDALEEKSIAMTTLLTDLSIKKQEEREEAVKTAIQIATQTLEQVKLQFGEKK